MDQKLAAHFPAVIASGAEQSRREFACYTRDCFVTLRVPRNPGTDLRRFRKIWKDLDWFHSACTNSSRSFGRSNLQEGVLCINPFLLFHLP